MTDICQYCGQHVTLSSGVFVLHATRSICEGSGRICTAHMLPMLNFHETHQEYLAFRKKLIADGESLAGIGDWSRPASDTAISDSLDEIDRILEEAKKEEQP